MYSIFLIITIIIYYFSYLSNSCNLIVKTKRGIDMENDPISISEKKSSAIGLWLAGIAFTWVITIIAFALSTIPGLDRLGSLAFAIIIAIIYRQFFGYPEALRSGIQFSAKRFRKKTAC
jgi:hypothetical protein